MTNKPKIKKVKDVLHCDVCGVRSDHLSDYFCMICQKCRAENYDINLLRKIGQLQTQIEVLKGETVL